MADNPFLASLVEAWGGNEASIPTIETEPFPDETLSPGMSEFVRIARRYLAGFVDDHTFVDSIQDMANRLGEYLTLHRQLIHSLPLTFPQQTLGQLSTQALIAFSDGLSDMIACFGKGDLPQVEQGIDRCKQAIIVLEAWWIELCRVVRYDTTRVCPECGSVNAAGSSQCTNCEHDLGSLGDEFQPDQEYLEVAPCWIDFYRLTQDMVSGKVAASQWSERLEELRTQVVELQSRIREIPAWEGDQELLTVELISGYEEVYEGLGLLRETIEEMQGSAQARQPAALNRSWYRLLSALQKLGRPCSDLRYELVCLFEDLEAELEC